MDQSTESKVKQALDDRVDLHKVLNDMEEAWEQKYRRLEETWQEIPRIMQQVQHHVDQTKNMRKALARSKSTVSNNSLNADKSQETSDSVQSLACNSSIDRKELDETIAAELSSPSILCG